MDEHITLAEELLESFRTTPNNGYVSIEDMSKIVKVLEFFVDRGVELDLRS